MFDILLWLVVGYGIGAMCSEYIYADPRRTHWRNRWVAFWLLCWPLGLLVRFGLLAALVVFVLRGLRETPRAI